jgi:hypothetical protein
MNQTDPRTPPALSNATPRPTELEKAIARWIHAKREQALREDSRGELLNEVRRQECDVEDALYDELEAKSHAAVSSWGFSENLVVLPDEPAAAPPVAEGPAATPRPLTRETIAEYVRGFYLYKGGQVAEEPTKCQWNDAISTVVSDILDRDANGDFSRDFDRKPAAAEPPEARAAAPGYEVGFDEQTEARWQTAIYKKLQSLVPEVSGSLDGSGCESGDALDVTLAEIEQAIGVITDARAEALGLLPGKLQGVQALADEKCRCFLQRSETAERQLDEARRELNYRQIMVDDLNGQVEDAWETLGLADYEGEDSIAHFIRMLEERLARAETANQQHRGALAELYVAVKEDSPERLRMALSVADALLGPQHGQKESE